MSTSLAPLHEALIADATADADAARAAAAASAAQQLEAARAQVDELVARARRDAERRAEEDAARRSAGQRRAARDRVLQARRAAYDRLRDATIAAALHRRSLAGYPALLDRLEADARARLGAACEIERDPDGVGGVRAREGGRTVDATLPELAERGLAALGPEIESLWR